LFPEFAENGSISDYIHVEHKQPSPKQRLLWLKQMAEGMDLGEILKDSTNAMYICQGTTLKYNCNL